MRWEPGGRIRAVSLVWLFPYKSKDTTGKYFDKFARVKSRVWRSEAQNDTLLETCIVLHKTANNNTLLKTVLS